MGTFLHISVSTWQWSNQRPVSHTLFFFKYSEILISHQQCYQHDFSYGLCNFWSTLGNGKKKKERDLKCQLIIFSTLVSDEKIFLAMSQTHYGSPRDCQKDRGLKWSWKVNLVHHFTPVCPLSLRTLEDFTSCDRDFCLCVLQILLRAYLGQLQFTVDILVKHINGYILVYVRWRKGFKCWRGFRTT